jgi:flagellar biosynthesis/type III secretory pathway chaperone
MDERDALLRQDTDALSAATDLKRRIVDELEALEKARRSLCIACGSGPDAAGMAGLLAECGAHAEIGKWHEVLSLAARCQEQNAINGAVIRLRRRQFAAALCIVRGSSREAIETYGPTGASTSLPSSRSLAEI